MVQSPDKPSPNPIAVFFTAYPLSYFSLPIFNCEMVLNLIGGPDNNRQTHQLFLSDSKANPYAQSVSPQSRRSRYGLDPSQNVDVTNLGLLDRVSMTNPAWSNCIRSDHWR
jgi:hypothetical protein